MSPYVDRVLSPETSAKMRKILLLPEDADLPSAVTDGYWRMKAACDRLNCPPTDQLFVMVVLGAGLLPPAPLPTFLELARSGKVANGEAVIVKWRSKDVDGVYLSLASNNRILVRVGGEERAVDHTTVRRAEMALA